MMTPSQIADHNQLCTELTERDGIPRLMWSEHAAAFLTPVQTSYTVGQLIAAADSATPGRVEGVDDDGHYVVQFPDLDGTIAYVPACLRPWPRG